MAGCNNENKCEFCPFSSSEEVMERLNNVKSKSKGREFNVNLGNGLKINVCNFDGGVNCNVTLSNWVTSQHIASGYIGLMHVLD